ncbi:MAG: SufD family Fe-S cluster assembly protein [Methanomicrobiales archaeon]
MISPTKDDVTKYVASQKDPKGYVIIAHKGSSNIFPILTYLYKGKDQIQHVNNIIIAEEGAELHIISGCTSGKHVGKGCAHYGISEFYANKNAKNNFTLIHNRSEKIEVYPQEALR